MQINYNNSQNKEINQYFESKGRKINIINFKQIVLISDILRRFRHVNC